MSSTTSSKSSWWGGRSRSATRDPSPPLLDPYATLSTSSEDARLTSPPPPFPSAVRPRAAADRHSRGLMLMSEEGNAVEGGGGRRCWKGQY